MNKLLKTTGIFILGIGLMTGCADKVAQKIDNNNNNATSEVTTTEETPTSLANLQKKLNILNKQILTLMQILLITNLHLSQQLLLEKTLQSNKLLKLENMT